MTMMISIRKYEYYLLGICLISIFVCMMFAGKSIRYDIFLFYDYSEHSIHEGRKLSMLVYEISSYLRSVLLSLILWLRIRNVFFFVPFFVLCVEFYFYLLFYGQKTDAYLILISGFMIFSLFLRYRYEKRIKI